MANNNFEQSGEKKVNHLREVDILWIIHSDSPVVCLTCEKRGLAKDYVYGDKFYRFFCTDKCKKTWESNNKVNGTRKGKRTIKVTSRV